MTLASRALDRIPPQALVVLSRALQALATPVVALLVATAASLSGEISHAISVCNVLFVGNLCAGLVVVTCFGPGTIMQPLRVLAPRQWLELMIFASLSALLSGLIFGALESTSVTNVVLLARLGPVLYVMGAALFLGLVISRMEWLGFALIGLGVLLVVLIDSDLMVSRGDLMIIASAVVYAVVTLLGKRLQPATGIAALVFARNVFSAVIFFAMANVIYGPHHFMDAFYGPLWGIMMVYALLIIVAGQFAWYRGIAQLTPASVARWTFFTPILAVLYAYLINGEQPSMSQLSALGFIMLGIIVSNISKFIPKGGSDNAEGSVAAS